MKKIDLKKINLKKMGTSIKGGGKNLKTWLLTGVSYSIPLIACGGILLALSIAFVPQTGPVPYSVEGEYEKIDNSIYSEALGIEIVPATVSRGEDGLIYNFAGEESEALSLDEEKEDVLVLLKRGESPLFTGYYKGKDKLSFSVLIEKAAELDWKDSTKKGLSAGIYPEMKDGHLVVVRPKGLSGGPDFSHSPFWDKVRVIGEAAFTLLYAVLAGYIAYAMAGKPGLAAGFTGGFLASNLPQGVSAGFLGALAAGLLAGWIVRLLKKLKVPSWIRPVMPILVIPIISTFITGILMISAVGMPIAELMKFLELRLVTLGAGNQVVLAIVLGAMIAFDMGGPVNKAAFFFGAAMIERGVFTVMGPIAAAICVPPLGVGLATFFIKKIWSDEERKSGAAAFFMGMIGITEGAIPFAAGDPLRVIPILMTGSVTASIIAMVGGVGNHAPHGGPVVLPVIDHRLYYVIAIVVGAAVTAGLMIFYRYMKYKKAEKNKVSAQ